jgi:CHASE2 domain-containing sensor protein
MRRERTVTEKLPLKVEAPPLTVFVGGIIGVMAWFLVAAALRRRMSGKSFAIAVIATLVVITLARFSASNFIPLPVTVDLKDSAAGFVVGLTWPITQKTILEKVFPKLK